MSETPVLTATCACGSIQLSLRGPPELTYLCHCLQCRKELGTMFATQVKYPPSAVKFVRGEDVLTKYSRPEDKLDPKTGITPNASFCSKCGSPVWCQGPDSLIIRYGIIDAETEESQSILNGSLQDVDEKTKSAWRPKFEFFVKRKAAWAKGWEVEGAPQRQELKN
ncbi:hypothetical protein MMC10_008199 [Thelotrema lepadinum]|nr:hypothetical protein [Thelotrema lepadinum]